MKRLLPLLLLLATAPLGAAAETSYLEPYESGTGFVARNALDECVLAELKRRDIEPSNLCSDAVFLRRVYVDVLGTLPEPVAVLRFEADRRPDRRARLIDELLLRDEYVDYWTLKWCDLLRVKAEFPIKLWPNGVQAYYRWIRNAVQANRPYDEFVRALLTSSGSGFRVPPVNFYRAVQDRSPAGLASAVALSFMGTRFEHWPAERQAGMQAFFSCLIYKATAEWKEEVVIVDPAPRAAFKAVFPDGVQVTIAPDQDPRVVFADWLLRPGNRHFARGIANRIWSWLLGRGIVHEPDDFRPDNPPSMPGLLARLERELVESGYDIKALFRLILNSRTYQGSPIPRSRHPEAGALFAHYAVRRLDAEVLIDALCRIDGRGENYMSMVPEPFTFLPNVRRSIRLEDGTITSPFLEMFGRPARDTGLEVERNNKPTDSQRLHLLNSRSVQQRIERSGWLRRVVSRARGNRLTVVRRIYVALLARQPTAEEMAKAIAYLKVDGRKLREGAIDLAWALINSKEFLYRH